MDKDKKQQVMLFVLIPVFLLSLIYMRMQQRSPVPASGTSAQFKHDSQIDALPFPKGVSNSVYTPSMQDPFKNLLQQHLYRTRKLEPIEKTALPLPKFTIEGIIWNTHIPQAIVNGQVVRIGDTIAGFSITGIDKQGIVIDYNGENVLIVR